MLRPWLCQYSQFLKVKRSYCYDLILVHPFSMGKIKALFIIIKIEVKLIKPTFRLLLEEYINKSVFS